MIRACTGTETEEPHASISLACDIHTAGELKHRDFRRHEEQCHHRTKCTANKSVSI